MRSLGGGDQKRRNLSNNSNSEHDARAVGGKQMVMWQRKSESHVGPAGSSPPSPPSPPLLLSRAHCMRISAPQIINIRGRGTGIFCGRRYDFVASRFELID